MESQPWLYNSSLAAGLAVPAQPSLLNYFIALLAQCGVHAASNLSQNLLTHSETKIQYVLKALFKHPSVCTRPRFGCNLSGAKPSLAKRLVVRLGDVLGAGRYVQGAAGDEASDLFSERGGDDDLCRKKHARKTAVRVRPREQPGEVPHDVVVIAEQAAGALGRS